MTTQLPPQDPSMPDEPLPGEAELAALYRKLPQSEPGPALDAAVLRAAAQAVASSEQYPSPFSERRKSPREPGDWVRPKHDSSADQTLPDAASPSIRHKTGPRWLIALSSAATLVLVAGLAWQMRGMPSAGTAPAAARYQATAAPALAAQPAEPMPPPPPPASLKAARAQAVAQGQVGHVSRRASATTPALQAQMASANGILSKAAAPPPVAEVSASSAPAVAALTPLPKPAPEQYRPTADASADEMSADQPRVTAPAAPAMLAPPAVAAPAPVAAPEEESIAANAGDTPAQELQKIRLLFAQHHDDEARQRLATFQHAHPQWDLPPELRAQLRKP
jgi:hypothetical protein